MHKLYILSLFLFIATLANLSPTEAKIPTIYLDPGHGGIDGGTSVGDSIEKDFNLTIALTLKKVLEDNNYRVYLTRDGDYDLATNPNARKRTDLAKRVELINESDCDLFISIHLNYFVVEKYAGSQVFYQNTNPNNELIGTLMQNALKYTLKNTTRKCKRIGNIYLLDHVTKPGILVECGFMSNPEELALLKQDSYILKLAIAMLNGINSYFLLP